MAAKGIQGKVQCILARQLPKSDWSGITQRWAGKYRKRRNYCLL